MSNEPRVKEVVAERPPDPELARAAAEVDRTLLDWMKSLTLVERLRAANAARGLQRFRRVPPQAG